MTNEQEHTYNAHIIACPKCSDTLGRYGGYDLCLLGQTLRGEVIGSITTEGKLQAFLDNGHLWAKQSGGRD